jgi:NAD-dependent DNA ligase
VEIVQACKVSSSSLPKETELRGEAFFLLRDVKRLNKRKWKEGGQKERK